MKQIIHQLREINFLKTGKNTLHFSGNTEWHNKLMKELHSKAKSNESVEVLDLVKDKTSCQIKILVTNGKKKHMEILSLKATSPKRSVLNVLQTTDKTVSANNFSKQDYYQHERYELIKLIGEESFKALMTGGKVKVWRNTTPHNYWIETKTGQMLWHSKDFNVPKLYLFDEKNGAEKVSYGSSLMAGNDAGMACSSERTLKEEFLTAWK